MKVSAERLLWAACAALAVLCVGLAVDRWGFSVAPIETTHAPALAALPATVPDAPPSPWLVAHFAAPLAPQGPAPAGFTPIEARLDAAACGACHVQQYLDWKASWHAGAMGPGVMGQLVGPTGVAQAATCQRCHAPLAEQIPATVAAAAEPTLVALQADGLSCAGCHVRAHTRSGPPKPAGETPMAGAPHGGFEPRDEFADSQFCAGCHDFTPNQRALEGKLLQETFAEWRRTPYAAEGVTCQGCHMPEGRHLWKGVHDPEMVRRAFTATTSWARRDGHLVGALDITNTGAGHRFPTYTTPQITLRVEQVDAAGVPIPGTAIEGALARRLTPDLKQELFDTRLLPGESHTLAYDRPLAAGAVAVRATVACWPDEGYRRFDTIEAEDPSRPPEAQALLQVALDHTLASRFLAWEEVRPLP
jgi:hypothetical protein